MSDPGTIASISSWMGQNPGQTLAIGTRTAKLIHDLITPSRTRELQLDVIRSQKEFRNRLARLSYGNFTAAERQYIRRAAEPNVNQTAAGVTSRGLGTSGAGAQIIAEAQQAPFQQPQQKALYALPAANKALLESAPLLDDDSFFENLLAIAKELEDSGFELKKTNGNTTDSENKEGENEEGENKEDDITNALYTLYTSMGSPEILGQGYI